MNENENKINNEAVGATPAVNEETSEVIKENDQTDTASEPETTESVEESAEESDDTSESADETAKEQIISDTAEPAKQEKRGRADPAFILSIALSGCAVILLIAIALASMFGLFKTTGSGGVVYIPVASPSNGTTYNDDSDMLESVIDSVVLIKAENDKGTATGTGIILSENGYVVTNYHIIENSSKIYVWLYGSEKPLTATVVGYASLDDVAVIKINKTGLKPATFAKSAEARIGERVYAIGTPEGDEFGWSVTQGIISCPDREIKLYNSDGTLKKKMRVIQTDASVNPGNSGGPIVNSRGEVVGIITLKLSDSAGMGFALPSDGVLIDIVSIIETGNADNVDSGISVSRPLIGVTGVGVEGGKWYETVVENGVSAIREVTEDYAKLNPSTTFYAEISGVRISAVSETLDAKGKILVGDIITKVNNIEVSTIYDVMEIINEFNGGDEVSITYYRNGKYGSVVVTLGTEQ